MPAQEKKNCTVQICQKKIMQHPAWKEKLYKAPPQKRKIVQSTLSEKKNCTKHPMKKEKLCKAPPSERKIVQSTLLEKNNRAGEIMTDSPDD